MEMLEFKHIESTFDWLHAPSNPYTLIPLFFSAASTSSPVTLFRRPFSAYKTLSFIIFCKNSCKITITTRVLALLLTNIRRWSESKRNKKLSLDVLFKLISNTNQKHKQEGHFFHRIASILNCQNWLSYIYPEAHPNFLRNQSAHSSDTASSHEPLDGVFGQHRVHVVPQDSPLSHWSSSSSYSSRTESKGCRGRRHRAEWSSSRCLWNVI